MINYYEKFVQPSKIIKDINYYYDQIKDLICNDIFSQYVYNKRKKTNTTFTIKNHLSCCDSTRLRFNNDTIIINFNQTDKSKVKITKPIYKKYKIEGITFFIDISLNEDEEKHKNEKNVVYRNTLFFRVTRHVSRVTIHDSFLSLATNL